MKNKCLHLGKRASGANISEMCNLKFVVYADVITFVIGSDNIEFPLSCIPSHSALSRSILDKPHPREESITLCDEQS